jgi:phenylpyruvate tautomerase PptA (4-oxalocrotonate tautomerase family)
MPLVTIETRRGLPAGTKKALFDGVHRALVECFKIPDRDRAQRMIEYAPEDFEIPADRGERFSIVTLTVFAGRSLDAKRALYRNIVDRFEAAGVPRKDVFIVLQEVPVENWGLRGGVAGCDIDFGFKIGV